MSKIGIQLEDSSVKWAKLSYKKNTFSIEQLQTETISKDYDVKPLYLTSLQNESLISGLESIEVLFREIELPTHEKRKILKLLPFQIESHLPYSLEEAIIGLRLILDQKGKKGKASIFSIRAPSLKAHIEKYTLKGLELSQVSCVPAALGRFFHLFFPNVPEAIILHVGEKTSVALYLENGNIKFSHTFPLELHRFSSKEDHNQIKKEVDRIFAFLESKAPESCSTFILTGDFTSSLDFPDFLLSHLPPSFEFKNLPPHKDYHSLTLMAYAIPIGLSLEGLMEDGKSLSFCQGPFSTPFIKEKKKKMYLSFIGATVALTCSMLIMGNIYLEKKKNQLIKGFSLLLPKENLPKSLDEIEKGISYLEAKEKKEQKNYPIALSTANVSETLAFLSTHPSLSKDIEITKYNYQLVKYPKALTPKDPYLGKVTLELKIKNPKTAAAFREKFCQNNPFINTKKEISWEEKGSFYSLSFFLASNKESSL